MRELHTSEGGRTVDTDDFLRQEPVSRQVMAAAGWLLGVSLACLAALVTLVCQQ